LPRLIVTTIASLAPWHQVSVFSDRVETRRGLLTEGCRVTVMVESWTTTLTAPYRYFDHGHAD
jgi:hypothetical protein